MERVSQLSVMANSEVLKEPRGFIKLLQIILAICAFATTTSYYDQAKFELKCPDASPSPRELHFSYPFRLNSWQANACNDTTEHLTMYGDFSAPSQFYVFVGVMAFLYSLGAVVLYVFADDKYQQKDTLPAADLVITVIFVLFWLISSSAWADGLTKVKHYSDPKSLCLIHDGSRECIPNKYEVQVQIGPTYANLNVSISAGPQKGPADEKQKCSEIKQMQKFINKLADDVIIFGFLNMLVWAGNIWFLYKETRWFGGNRGSMDPQTQHGGSAGYPGDLSP